MDEPISIYVPPVTERDLQLSWSIQAQILRLCDYSEYRKFPSYKDWKELHYPEFKSC